MTLWSVEVSHFIIPTGPWCSPSWPPAPWSSSETFGRSVRRVISRGSLRLARLGRGQPLLELSRSYDLHTEAHLRVVQTAVLRALARVGADGRRGEVELVGDSGLGITAEVELWDIKAVDGVSRGEHDANGLALGKQEAGVLVTRE